MRSLLSLFAALLVVGGLAAGGPWLYRQTSGSRKPGGTTLVLSSQEVSLALTNGTQYALTVDMRRGPELVNFQILPGETETRSFAPGAYQVVGKISDANTDPFSTQWTFQSGGRYNANFSRDGKGNTDVILVIAGRGSSTQPPKKQ
jgi:hypothetical protein